MQFLVYVTVLMVSISTVLLEVHWLTSPAPQPKPAVQTANTNVARPKIEGPNAELSPVYPKPETPRPATTASSAQQSDTVPANSNASGSDGAPAPPASVQQLAPTSATTNVTSSQQPAVDTTANAEPKAEPMQKLPETTGVATRTDDAKPAPSAAVPLAASNRVDDPSPLQQPAVASNNRCDIQACASAYKSFRASDCSYQPFDGSRRFCEKPPVQRTAREQRDEPERRTWSRDLQQRNVERAVKSRVDSDDEIDDSALSDDEDSDQIIVIRRQGPRW
ncbi:MAG: BA14K family protein [Pseudolabrys sp.]